MICFSLETCEFAGLLCNGCNSSWARLHARHCSKHSRPQPYQLGTRAVVTISPFYRSGSWGTKRLGLLPRVTGWVPLRIRQLHSKACSLSHKPLCSPQAQAMVRTGREVAHLSPIWKAFCCHMCYRHFFPSFSHFSLVRSGVCFNLQNFKCFMVSAFAAMLWKTFSIPRLNSLIIYSNTFSISFFTFR